MSHCLSLFFILFILGRFDLHAEEELVRIEAVSNSKKTFVTRTGYFKNISRDSVAAFLHEDVSFTARAAVVTREYAQWLILNPQLRMPFNSGEYIMINRNQEVVVTNKKIIERPFSTEEEEEDQDVLLGINNANHFKDKERLLDQNYTNSNNPVIPKYNWEKELKQSRAGRAKIKETAHKILKDEEQLAEEMLNEAEAPEI